jgi:hypothetical protein
MMVLMGVIPAMLAFTEVYSSAFRQGKRGRWEEKPVFPLEPLAGFRTSSGQK